VRGSWRLESRGDGGLEADIAGSSARGFFFPVLALWSFRQFGRRGDRSYPRAGLESPFLVHESIENCASLSHLTAPTCRAKSHAGWMSGCCRIGVDVGCTANTISSRVFAPIGTDKSRVLRMEGLHSLSTGHLASPPRQKSQSLCHTILRTSLVVGLKADCPHV
jgi:hypothetical protein